jgi:hypothetical protein
MMFDARQQVYALKCICRTQFSTWLLYTELRGRARLSVNIARAIPHNRCAASDETAMPYIRAAANRSQERRRIAKAD